MNSPLRLPAAGLVAVAILALQPHIHSASRTSDPQVCLPRHTRSADLQVCLAATAGRPEGLRYDVSILPVGSVCRSADLQVCLAPASAQVVVQSAPARSAPQIDVAQLMRDVEVLAADDMEGRRAGTPGGARARAYLLARFNAIGMKPLTDAFEHPFTFSGRGDSAPREGVNLLGVIRGTHRPDRFVVVTAHYDHVGVRSGEVFNGADDNATGVAALLAAAAHFVRNPPAASLVIAALDAEESGLRGARAFLASGVVAQDAIAMNVNLDMLGRDADNVLYAAGTHHYPQLKPLLEGVAQPPVELRFGHDIAGTKIENWTNASDHAVFHRAGIPFIYFGVEDFEHHHKANDDAATIQREFFAGAVRTVIVALERLAGRLPVLIREQGRLAVRGFGATGSP